MSSPRLPEKALRRASVALVLGLTAVGGLGVVRSIRDPVGPRPEGGFEALRAGTAYRTSHTCAPCHRDHVQSWRRTFHRTMTQEASPRVIQAPFDGHAVEALGVRSVPSRSGDSFFLATLDPRTDSVAPQRVVRVTGSRRMEQFETWENDRYVRLPLAWSIEERRWLHLSEAFFHADGEGFHAPRAVWDLNCIFCHTTKPVPGLDERDRVASRSAELGIACEACHGPGEEHARRMRSPLRRYAFRVAYPADPTIVQPGRLDKVRSVQVCGHCHGQRLPVDGDRIREILGRGDPYTPGEDLSRYYVPVTRESMLGSYSFAPRFWPDGSPRLTAYEYQGLLRSKCYLRGEMTCLSCHTMHAGDPRGQMRPDLPGDAICTQCHEKYSGAKLTQHTRHAPGSSGSRCLPCHMPPVVYGIMTWHPTHEIASPDPLAAAAGGMPDACTVCHTGKSAGWAALWSERWWPRRGEFPAAAGREAPEIVRALFAGDVVYRTLAAARLGEPSPDPEIAGRVVPLLAELLLDPYPNVRRTAHASLERLTGRSDLPFANDPQEKRAAAARELQAAAAGVAPLPAWPFGRDGALDRGLIEEWKRERKEVPVFIGE